MNTQDIVCIALFAAITAALGIIPGIVISVIGVPISVQSLGVMLSGSILGAKRGALSQILFLGIVSLGLPVLAGGHGGLGPILGPSGGFLLGWPIATFVIGFLFKKSWSNLTNISAFIYIIIGGILIMYTIGILWLNIIINIPINQAFIGSMIFIPGDIIKAIIATTIAMVVKRSYPIIQD
ncbi:MAG: biotin transporter BioY [Rickettsia endosymbiont of Sergentomyia squamirostris]|uniref:Biotin transporter n=1 Tax=Candidatus Tisiphia endosymbiont of Sergentomyia squamirostris TaxID=3113639 RepID=A0AAT9G865_9RICK